MREDFFSFFKQESQKHKDAYYQFTTKQLVPRYMIETILMTVLVSLAILCHGQEMIRQA